MIGPPLYSTTIEHPTGDYGPFYVPNSVLNQSRPAIAKYLLLVVDPEDKIREPEANNLIALPIPDINILSVTTTDSRSVSIDYEITGIDLEEVPLRLYRSADTTPDQWDQEQTIVAGSLSGAVGRRTATLQLSQALTIDPSRDFILAEVDPDDAIIETNELNNHAHFRKWVLGAVTHGWQGDGQFPTWVTDMTSALVDNGYDAATFHDWASQSNRWDSGWAEIAGHNLAAEIRGTADALAALRGLEPHDVIDLHVIGHSRGAVVISQALHLLQTGGTAHLDGGYVKMTMLDPHPAANLGPLSLGIAEVLNPINFNGVSNIGQFSFDRFNPLSRLAIATGALAFQEVVQDPPVSIPGNVDEAEVYYQHTLARDVRGRYRGLPEERSLINLGGRPVSGAALNLDLTNIAPGISHTGVIRWYRENVLGDFGTSGGVGGSAFSGPGITTLARPGSPLLLVEQLRKMNSPVTLRPDATPSRFAADGLFALLTANEESFLIGAGLFGRGRQKR